VTASRSARLALTALGLLLYGSSAGAQSDVLVPNQMHTSLTFELHSVKDEVLLYEGDPEYLFRIDLRPVHTLPPKVEFNISNQAAVLRVRDLWLFDAPSEPVAEDDDPDMPRDNDRKRPPVSQQWDVRLVPSSPTDFVLQCDGGKATFDFSNMPVRSVHILADTTRVEVDFQHPNSVACERFKLTARNGSVKMRSFLSARAASTTLQVAASKLDLDLSGKSPPGESELFIEGGPTEVRVSISADVGLHIEGPSASIMRFDRDDFVRRDLALESGDFATRARRVRLYLAENTPKPKVQWTD
jgi:hypothetical protein